MTASSGASQIPTKSGEMKQFYMVMGCAVVGGATGAVVTAPWSPFGGSLLLSPPPSLPLV